MTTGVFSGDTIEHLQSPETGNKLEISLPQYVLRDETQTEESTNTLSK